MSQKNGFSLVFGAPDSKFPGRFGAGGAGLPNLGGPELSCGGRGGPPTFGGGGGRGPLGGGGGGGPAGTGGGGLELPVGAFRGGGGGLGLPGGGFRGVAALPGGGFRGGVALPGGGFRGRGGGGGASMLLDIDTSPDEGIPGMAKIAACSFCIDLVLNDEISNFSFLTEFPG